MDLVQVDIVRPEAAEGLLDLVDDPAAGVALHIRVVRIFAHLAVHFRGEHDRVPAPLQSLADDLFRLTPGVGICGVDEVDADIEGAVDDPHRLVMVGVPRPAEHHRPQAVGADVDSGASEAPIAHGLNPKVGHRNRPFEAAGRRSSLASAERAGISRSGRLL